MRIVVVNNFFPPRLGGSSHMAAALAEQYVARGHEVLVLTAAYPGAPAEEEMHGFRVIRLPAMKMPKLGLSIDFDMTFVLARPGNVRRVTKILDAFRPDVIHQHGQFFDLTWLTGWYARRRKVPVLLSIHTLLLSPRWHYTQIFKFLDRFMVRPNMRYYRPRYGIMDEMGDRYVKQRYRGSEADFEYIPVPVEPARFAGPPRKDIRAEYGIGDAPLIVSLGHVIPLRNRLPLIEALPRILAKHPETKVLVAGRVYYDAFLKRAKELGVEDAIIVAGLVAKEDVPSYFAAADLVTHDLNGGCGTASLEAMIAGRATVATVTETNFPGVELRNWENFLLVPPDDAAALGEAVIRLLDDPTERETIAKRQRELVMGHFTMDAVTGAHLAAFEQMLAEAGTTRE